VIDGIFGVMARARAVYPDRSPEYADWLVRENLLGENLGLTALAAFGLVWLARRRPADGAAMAVWCAVTGMALITQRPVWPKHHWSLVLWPLAVLAGVGVAGIVGMVRDVRVAWRAGGVRRLCPGRRGLAAGLALAVWLAALTAQVGRLRELANPRQFAAVAYGLEWLGEHTAADATILSDNGLLAFITGRRVPPELAVVSSKRIAIGDLTATQIIAAAERTGAAAVLIWNNHLTNFDDFMSYLPTRYVREQMVGDDREIWRRFDPAAIAHPQAATLFEVAQLDGYDLPRAKVEPGDTIPLTLFWRAAGPTPVDYTAFVHVVDSDGHTVAQADGPPAGGTPPSSLWVPGQIVIDAHAIEVPPDIQPGTYRLSVGIYDPRTSRRVGAGRPDGSLWPDGGVVLGIAMVVADDSGR